MRRPNAGCHHSSVVPAHVRTLLAVLAACLSACSSAPDSFLGVGWGDDVGAAESRLGITCGEWRAWSDEAFETCEVGRRDVLGREAATRLIRHDRSIEGMQFLYGGCAAFRDELLAALAEEFDTETGSDYTTWSSGELVRLEMQDEDCLLTVAGPVFGEAFQRQRAASSGFWLGPR